MTHQSQQNLVLASLAMKAKKYEVVISSLEDIENQESQVFAETVLMKTKAYQKLNKISDAVQTLKSFSFEAKATASLWNVSVIVLSVSHLYVCSHTSLGNLCLKI